MPKLQNVKKVLVIGSGPIIIGQAAEFDYSGTQACRALKEEGLEVVLVNSNPATIMTDVHIADRVYVEPVNVEFLESVIKRERPDALLATLGGQVGLNLAIDLDKQGILREYNVKLLGTQIESIKRAEDRELFKETMEKINQPIPESTIVETVSAAKEFAREVGYPLIVRPAYTLGGTGGGIANNDEELDDIVSKGLLYSLIGQALIERSVAGWKEIEYEVLRDADDNCITVCSMENLDPVGVHTGDSVVAAPAQTLSDHEVQMLRQASIDIVRELGVRGACNVQLALDPNSYRYYVIEVNPRVSRSSALASKATGYPIAKVATKIAVGYTLDEIQNAVTQKTTACFEPSLDYVVLKFPRWPFDKFVTADRTLGTQMKATGEVMAIERNLEAALLKAVRSLEIGLIHLEMPELKALSDKEVRERIHLIDDQRLFVIAEAFRRGVTIDEVHDITKIDKWFLQKVMNIVEMENRIKTEPMTAELMLAAKKKGFADVTIAGYIGKTWQEVREMRKGWGIIPTYKMVDTCAAEFEAATPYYYSTYAEEDEVEVSDKKKVAVLGSGPIRIGQGVEFDYCSVHSVWALKELGYETIIINNNPETVSTDFDTSDRLYFEPLTIEDVLNILDKEKPEGVIVQFGGQTAINLAGPLEKAGIKILGSSVESIDRAEDRERFQALIEKLGLLQPPNGTAMDLDQALEVAERITYPVVVRPSYVLGGRAMAVVYDKEELVDYFREQVPEKPEHPILIDKFLEHAVEVDVDALSDGKEVYVAGIMEHIEEAGIHSGDSACVLPSFSLSYDHVALIAAQAEALARELKVVGLMNIQFAIKGDDLYILEVNPRASRTAPFVSKATGVPLPYMATQVMLGKTLDELDPWSMRRGGFTCVKEAVLPFQRFPGVDIILGPEMHSTGEVMGMGSDFPEAYYKSQLASGQDLPQGGNVFISVNDRDKPILPEVAAMFADLGFHLLATRGTARYLRERGLEVEEVLKVYEGRPNIVDRMINGDVALVINTASGKNTARDSKSIRHTAVSYGVPYCTTVAGAKASAIAIGKRREDTHVESLQEYYAREARG